MEIEFVSYEQAVALKELGFNEHVWCTYDKRKVLNFEDDGPNRNSDVVKWVSGDRVCSAPLKQQVFRWFREKYEMIGYVDRLLCGSYEDVISSPNLLDWEDDITFSTYEEAENNCINRLLEIAKKNLNNQNK